MDIENKLYNSLLAVKELLDGLREAGQMSEAEHKEEILRILTDREFKKLGEKYPRMEELANAYQKDLKLSEKKARVKKEKNIIANSEPVRKLLSGTQGIANVGRGQALEIIKGQLTPLQLAITEAVISFKLENKVINGKPWFTIPELFRKMRHGKGTTRVTAAQVRELEEEMYKLRAEDIVFRLNEVMPGWSENKNDLYGEPMLTYKFFEKTVRGQKTKVIVVEALNPMILLMEQMWQYEPIPQEVKAIMYVSKSGELKPYNMTSGRIELATVLGQFLYSYLRARTVNKIRSSKLPYSDIFEKCRISQKDRMAVKRAKESIAVILDHYQRLKDFTHLKSWKEYTNKGSSKPNGIEIGLE